MNVNTPPLATKTYMSSKYERSDFDGILYGLIAIRGGAILLALYFCVELLITTNPLNVLYIAVEITILYGIEYLATPEWKYVLIMSQINGVDYQ